MLVSEIAVATGVVLALGGFSWKMVAGSDERNDMKVKRVYDRFDVFKKDLAETHVRKELCELQHKYTTQILEEIKSDVKFILKEIRNGKSGKPA